MKKKINKKLLTTIIATSAISVGTIAPIIINQQTSNVSTTSNTTVNKSEPILTNNVQVLDSNTTSFNTGTLSGVSDILPQFAVDNSVSPDYTNLNNQVVDAIKTFLLDNNIINLPPSVSISSISKSDLDVTLNGYNNQNGTINAIISLNNNKGWQNGQIQPTVSSQTLTFLGLKQQPFTDYLYKDKDMVIDSSYSNLLSSQFTEDQAQQYLDAHQNEIFSNLPSGAKMMIKDFDNKTNVKDGKITLQIDTTWYYIEGSSQLISNLPPDGKPGYWPLTITGFKTFDQDPTLFTTTVNGTIHLTGMDQVLAQDATSDSNWDNVKNQVFAAISAQNNPYVQNLAYGASVSQLVYPNVDLHCNPAKLPEDKEIIGSDIFWDNSTGTITVRLELDNSLYWSNGVPQEKFSFPLKITGFKAVGGPTTVNQTTFNVGSQWNQKFATDYSSDDINNFISQNKNTIFTNLPSDATVSIVGQPTYSNKDGTITFQVNTNQYYSDQNGTQFINSSMPSPTTITLNGFLNMNNNPDAFTTKISGGQLANVSTILPQFAADSQNHASENQTVIKAISDYVLNGNIQNLPPQSVGNISASDLSISISGYDNLKGTVDATIILGNSKGWTNGNIEQNITFNVTFSGLQSINVTRYIFEGQMPVQSPYNQDFSCNFTIDNAKSFLNSSPDIKNQLFSNLPPDAIIWVKDGSLQYNTTAGTVTLEVAPSTFYDITTSQYTVNDASTCLWDTLTITGFKNTSTDPTAFTTTMVSELKSSENPNGQPPFDKLPQEFASLTGRDLQLEKLLVSQVLSGVQNGYGYQQQNVFSNLAQPQQEITPMDIKIGDIVDYNNLNGTMTFTVTLTNNKGWINGVPQDVTGNIKLYGFKTQQPTTINPNLNLPNVSNQLPVSVTKDDIQNAINSNPDLKNQIGTNLPPNANITVDNVDTSDPSLSDNGQVKVTVSISPSYDANGNLTDTPIQQTITVGGFKPSENVNTSITNPNFDLSKVNSVNNVLPTDVAGSNPSSNEVTQFTDAIKQYIVDNQNQIFSNLNPNTPLTKDDITIGNLTNPINKDGTVHLDSITINGSKVLVNGQPSQSNVTLNNNGEGFNLSGLKTQAPTSWNNFNTESNIGNVTLAGANQIEVGSVTNDSLTSLINQSQSNKDQFLSNLPSDATISATIDSNGYDLANGTITCTVTASSSFDSNGNPAGSISNKYVIGQFIKNTSTTTVNNVDLTNQANTIPSEINASNQDAIINDIKNQLINSGAIQNTNPTVTTPISPNDINVTITGSDNLTGKVKVDVTVNNPYYMENGQVTTQTTPTQIEVGGFKTLQPTNVPDSVVSNAIGNDKNINQIVNDPNTISNIQNAISNALDNNMFPSGTKPSPDQIKVEITNQDPANGSCTVKVTIPGPYVDDQGNIINQDRVIEVPISGCPKDTSTTNAISGTLNNCNNIIPSDLEKNNSILNNQVMQAMIDAGLIKNLTSGKTGFTTNDMTIEIVDTNNLSGSANVKVTINNDYACKDGTPQNSMTLNEVTVNGLMKLAPTPSNATINVDSIDPSLKNISPTDFSNSANLENSIKGLIVNGLEQNATGNMFPPKDSSQSQQLQEGDIKINQPITVNDQDGTVSVSVTINRNWVDANGKVMPGPKTINITLGSFAKSVQGNWIENNWWIILVSVVGTALLLIIILLIIKKARERDYAIYGY